MAVPRPGRGSPPLSRSMVEFPSVAKTHDPEAFVAYRVCRCHRRCRRCGWHPVGQWPPMDGGQCWCRCRGWFPSTYRSTDTTSPTVRGRCRVVTSVHHDQFTLFTGIGTKPVHAVAVIVIRGQAGGGVANARRPTVIARRVRVGHGDVGKRTVDAALSIRWCDVSDHPRLAP